MSLAITSRVLRPTTALQTLALAMLSLGAAHAQNCIELKNEVQMEQEYTEANGQKAKRLVPVTKIVPGNEVVYTLSARNVCDKSADKVVIDNPVPQHTTYVMGSAMGTGTDITYSLDGKTFAKAEALSVKNADGSTRAASAADIKAIRWTYTTPIGASQVGFVRFRATIN